MSAGKLSRIAGSVFVLAAVLGGIGVSSSGVEHGTGGSATANYVKVAGSEHVRTSADSEIIWN